MEQEEYEEKFRKMLERPSMTISVDEAALILLDLACAESKDGDFARRVRGLNAAYKWVKEAKQR